jgi:hypothetical protein
VSPKLLIVALLGLAAALLVAGVFYFGAPATMAGPDGLDAGATVSSERGLSDDDSGPGWSGGTGSVAESSGRLRLAGGGNTLLGLASIEDGAKREAYLRRIVRSLAALGPEAALARVGELEDEDLRDMAMLALLQEWSGVTTLELIRSGNIWRFGVEGSLGLHLLESGKITPERAAEMATTSRGANRPSELLARIAADLAETNPAAALALADGLDERQRMRFIDRMASNLAESSPAAARALAARLTDPAARSAMLARILDIESAADPAGAARNFLSQPPETPQGQSQAAQRIASNWASRDTLAALQWAGTLSDENLRTAAQRGIEAVAPVGIGARLGRSDGGLPVLQDMVPGSPASASGQLRNGDAILAVSNANGEWVDSRSVRMGELIGLIRGEPNTRVTLQVQSPGESAPRTVTLGRQQIIYRPQ